VYLKICNVFVYFLFVLEINIHKKLTQICVLLIWLSIIILQI